MRFVLTSFLLGDTLVSAIHHYKTIAIVLFGRTYLLCFLSPLVHFSPIVLISKSFLCYITFLKDLLLKPAHLLATHTLLLFVEGRFLLKLNFY
jgi:hypothetical protein